MHTSPPYSGNSIVEAKSDITARQRSLLSELDGVPSHLISKSNDLKILIIFLHDHELTHAYASLEGDDQKEVSDFFILLAKHIIFLGEGHNVFSVLERVVIRLKAKNIIKEGR